MRTPGDSRTIGVMTARPVVRAASGALAVLAVLPAPAVAATPSRVRLERISVPMTGSDGEGVNLSIRSDITPDGRYVAFVSWSRNLVGTDDNRASDVFVRDRHSGTTELVSASWTGGPGDAESDEPSISADGRAVAFASIASDLVAPTSVGELLSGRQIYVREAGTTTLVSIGCTAPGVPCRHSVDPAISADGRWVAFVEYNDDAHVYLHDRTTGTTRLASPSLSGAVDSGGSWSPDISADGSTVVFASASTDLVEESDPGGGIFAFDAATRSVSRVSHVHRPVAGKPSISADGRLVAFTSRYGEVPEDTDGEVDAYVRDRVTGTLALVGVGNVEGGVTDVSLSPDGRFLSFTSVVPDPAGSGGSGPDLFLRDLSRASARPVLVAEAVEYWGGGGALSTGAAHISFSSSLPLDSRDDNGMSDVYLRRQD